MSIGSIGMQTGLSQTLANLLSQLSGTSATTANTPADTSESGGADASFATCDGESGSNNQLTGSSKATISDQILGLLVLMQQQASANASGSTAASSTSIATSSTSADPLQNLIAAIDSDGDGSVSQSEMESFIEKNGGTQSEADALFNGLNQNGSGNLTTAQLTTDLAQGASSLGGAQHVHGHHHHHGGGMSAAQDLGSLLEQAMDTNGDGSVDQSEFESFVTNLGGTTSEADADFAGLDSQNTGTIDAAQFTNAIKAFETANQNTQAMASGAGAQVLDLLDTLKQSTTQDTTTTSASSGVTA